MHLLCTLRVNHRRRVDATLEKLRRAGVLAIIRAKNPDAGSFYRYDLGSAWVWRHKCCHVLVSFAGRVSTGTP